MAGFTGTVYHQVDEKGRVRIPSKFLSKCLEEGADSLVVPLALMAGSQGCISVYTLDALGSRLEELDRMPETSAEVIKRKIRGSVEESVTDKQGRLVIPPNLRNIAQINRDLVTVGMGDHFEIWSKDVFEKGEGDMSFETAFSLVGFF